MIIATKNENQKELEQIFNVVDQLKADLNQHEVWTYGDQEKLEILVEGKKITWEKKGLQLFRDQEPMIICDDWFVQGFPDCQSVLYRLSIGSNKIRGYVFTNKEVVHS